MPEPVGVCVAFDDDALADDPVWTRLDGGDGYRLATGWQTARGRQSELDKTGTGTSEIDMVDRTGILDPTNGTGPLAGKLDPGLQAAIALRNPCTDTWSQIYRGFTAEWGGDFYPTGRRQNVTLQLADAFDVFSALEMTPGNQGDKAPADSEGDIYFGATTGIRQVASRINQALDDAGWPAAWRRIFSGNVQLQGTTYARLDQLLTVIQDAADAEFPGVANAYMSKNGLVTFHGRFARFTPELFQAVDDESRAPHTSIVFWEAGSRDVAEADGAVAAITGLSWRRSVSDIVNACLALPRGVDAADVPDSLVTDPDSIARYGWRSLSFEDLLVEKSELPVGTAVADCKLYSTYYVQNYARPHTRVTTLSFKGRGPDDPLAPALWKLMCGIDIGDVLHLKTTHFGGLGGFDEDFYVEGIRYTSAPKREGADPYPQLTLELDVSPAALYTVNPFA